MLMVLSETQLLQFDVFPHPSQGCLSSGWCCSYIGMLVVRLRLLKGLFVTRLLIRLLIRLLLLLTLLLVARLAAHVRLRCCSSRCKSCRVVKLMVVWLHQRTVFHAHRRLLAKDVRMTAVHLAAHGIAVIQDSADDPRDRTVQSTASPSSLSATSSPATRWVHS